jgi:hypothetical protein
VLDNESHPIPPTQQLSGTALSRTVARMIAQAKQPSGGNIVRLSDARSKSET